MGCVPWPVVLGRGTVIKVDEAFRIRVCFAVYLERLDRVRIEDTATHTAVLRIVADFTPLCVPRWTNGLCLEVGS